MSNPILTEFNSQPDYYKSHDSHTAAFDVANGTAWVKARRPNDGPGSQWAEWETEALRVIEAEYAAPKYATAWAAIDAMLSEWEDYDGDVSDFYSRWTEVLEVRK